MPHKRTKRSKRSKSSETSNKTDFCERKFKDIIKDAPLVKVHFDDGTYDKVPVLSKKHIQQLDIDY